MLEQLVLAPSDITDSCGCQGGDLERGYRSLVGTVRRTEFTIRVVSLVQRVGRSVVVQCSLSNAPLAKIAAPLRAR